MQMEMCPKLYWSKKEGIRTVQFDGIPFSIEKVTLYDCQYGEHYWKDKPCQNKRLKLQNTRKIGCHAHIVTQTYRLYPEFKMSQNADNMVTSHYQLRKCKENLLITARVAIKDGSAKSCTKHFVSLPTQSAHFGHPVGVNASFCQRTHPIIIQKISELVSSGIIETREVQRVLENYVKHNLQGEHGISPHSSGQAFHPLPVDIKNHVDNAKRALELSKLDQENLCLKIKSWKKKSPDSLHHFRPYVKSHQTHDDKSEASQVQNSTNTSTSTEVAKGGCERYTQTMLWVHQENWQKELLVKYENIITLIDATYKTTKYDLALFFVFQLM